MFFHFSLFRTPPLAPGFEVRNPTLSHLTGMWNSHADIVHISRFINASPVCADKDEAPNSDLPEESLPRAKNDSSAYSALRCPSPPRGQSTTSDRGRVQWMDDVVSPAARMPLAALRRVPLSDGGREMNICTYLLIRRREWREGERQVSQLSSAQTIDHCVERVGGHEGEGEAGN